MVTGVVSQIGDGGGSGESATAVSSSISTALSTAESSVTSESASFSTSISSDLSMINSLSTVISSSISSDISLINSLSTAVGSGGGIAKGQIFGLILSPDATSTVLDISAGNCADSTAAALITLGAFTKAIGSAWAAGSGNGSLDTGAIANSTWYHVYAISKAAGASPDILTSLSATSPTMPSTYTLFRRIGSFKTNGSSQVTPFSQFADEFKWAVQVSDLNVTPADSNAHLFTATVPSGVKVMARGIVYCNPTASGNGVLFTGPDDTDSVPGGTGAGPFTAIAGTTSGGDATFYECRTNTSAQLRYRAASTSFTNVGWMTVGWRDDRGRNQ